MGNNEESKSSKTEKSATPVAPDLRNVQMFHPDWAAMQAYYGPRVALPPYYSTHMSSGPTPHPYMWAPAQYIAYESLELDMERPMSQAMMPPYGTPYTAVYPPGGIYTSHPGVVLGSAPGNVEASSSAKPPGNTDCGQSKKLKSLDGVAMSIGDGTADAKQSHSSETEVSSEGTTTSGGDQGRKRRSSEGTSSGNRKPEAETTEVIAGNNKVMGALVVHSSGTGKYMGPVSPTTTTALELRTPSSGNLVTMPGEAGSQNERELKRERRKQSNRDSARRSRLRKQAETEDLAKKVQRLMAEKETLKSDIGLLMENFEKLKHENATLVEKLGKVQSAKSGGRIPGKLNGVNGSSPISTENLLSRVDNNSGLTDRSNGGDDETYKRKSSNSNAGTKLHQLLDSKHRTDAVVAAG